MASVVAIQEPLVPPFNFAMVCPGIYRSGYPTRKNFQFLRALRLRSILYLCPEEYAESNLKFCEENNINVLRFPTEGNKEPFFDIPEPLMHRILTALCDTRHHPVLIHCNKGKHRTGTITACLRLIQNWSLVSIFEEYKQFAGDKVRVCDQQYVELYSPIVRVTPSFAPQWLCDGMFSHPHLRHLNGKKHPLLMSSPKMKIVATEQELVVEEAKQQGYSVLGAELKSRYCVPITTTKGNIITTSLSTEPPAQSSGTPASALVSDSANVTHSCAAGSVKTLTSISASSAGSNAIKINESERINGSHPIASHVTVSGGSHDATAGANPAGCGIHGEAALCVTKSPRLQGNTAT